MRRSKYFNDVHISLLTNQKQNLDFLDFIKNKFINISGFIFAYSNPKSFNSVFSEILENYGQEYIREKILNMEFKYYYQSFFQNNIELFEEVLKIMKNNSSNFKKIIDLYCGIGIIGLNLKDFASNIIGIDYDKNSIQYAALNSLENNIVNFSAYSLLDSKIDNLFLKDCDLLILDPPRSGLHPKLIKKILDFKPKNIFYLSCNPITQARDYFNLKQIYKLKKFMVLIFIRILLILKV